MQRCILVGLLAWLVVILSAGFSPDTFSAEPPQAWTGRVLPLKYEPQRRDIPVVTGLTVQSAGPLLAAAGDDHDVRVWNRSSGELVWRLKGHSDWVRVVAFSPDGRVLASGGNDRRVILWDTETGRKKAEFAALPGTVTTLVFNHHGDRLAATGYESPLLMFDAQTPRQIDTWKCPCIDMRAIAFSPDDQLLAGAGRNGKVRVWQLSSGKVVKEYQPHKQRVRDILFTRDGERIVSCGEDRLIVIAPVHSDEIRTLPATQAKILSMCLVDSWLAIGCSDNTIRLWDLDEQREFAVLEGHEGSVAVLKSAGELIISGSYDTTVRAWNITSEVSAPR